MPNAAIWTKLIWEKTRGEAFKLYYKMRDEGVIPNHYTFVAALKACSTIAQLRRIHSHVNDSGPTNIFVANTLLDMYAKCGSIEEARLVFDEMRHRNVVSWNAIIMANAHMGASALELYARMQIEGFIPDARTFAAALKACVSLAAAEEEGYGDLLKASYLEQGRAIHVEIVKRGFELDSFVGNILVDMYMKCRSIEDARQVFEKMKNRDVVSWTTMIIGYAQMEMGDSALILYARMQMEGFLPNDRTFVAALKACASLAAQEAGTGSDAQLLKPSYLEQGRAIHAEITKRGFDSDLFVANTVVDMYAKCGSIDESRQLFENMRHRDLVSWTVMIIGYIEMEMGASALELYARMQNEGLAPDARIFAATLKACAILAAQDGGLLKTIYLEQGRTIHADIMKAGFESDVFVGSTLVDMYAKFGSIEDAWQAFKKIRYLNVVSWNTMIIGYSQMGMGDLALRLYACMQHEGFIPDAHTFVAVLKACANLAAQEAGNELLVKKRYLALGRAIHAEVSKNRFESDVFVASTLVDMYAKCGNIDDARHIFEKMRHRNVVPWNAMISGYAQIEMGDLALELYACMQCEGIIPDAPTFVAVLQACSGLASLETGKAAHSQIHRAGLQGDLGIANSLINMYGKCGSMSDAQYLFDSLLVRNSVTWNALIEGYSCQGDCRYVFDLYKRMQQEGIKPNSITFVSVLNVCSHNGLVDKGQMYFQAMCLEHGVILSVNHYTCMIDLLGRAGQLDEATTMVMKMPFQPQMVIWTTILGACQRWNNLETGRNTFECAMMLDAEFAAAHVLMTNIRVFSDI